MIYFDSIAAQLDLVCSNLFCNYSDFNQASLLTLTLQCCYLNRYSWLELTSAVRGFGVGICWSKRESLQD